MTRAAAYGIVAIALGMGLGSTRPWAAPVLAQSKAKAHGNVYVADEGNKRIQIFDNAGTVKSQIENIGVPGALCISGGSHQYVYSSHAGDPYGMDDAAIYKLELDGRIVGRFGKAGKLPKEFGLVNAIDCRKENELYVGELTNWRVQKLTLHPAPAR